MIQAVDFKYLKHFLLYAKKYKTYAFIGMSMLPISIATNLAFPWLTIKIIDEHLALGVFDGLINLVIAMVVVIALNYLSETM
jgi:ATP-binding cassette subfamily B protein